MCYTPEFYYRLIRCAGLVKDEEELYLTIRKHGCNNNLLKIKSIKFVNNHCKKGYCALNDRTREVTVGTFLRRYVYRQHMDINVRSGFRVSLRIPV